MNDNDKLSALLLIQGVEKYIDPPDYLLFACERLKPVESIDDDGETNKTLQPDGRIWQIQDGKYSEPMTKQDYQNEVGLYGGSVNCIFFSKKVADLIKGASDRV